MNVNLETAPANNIKIDGVDYELESLTHEAKLQLAHIRAIDVEIKRLEAHVAIFKTARASYGQALRRELGKANNAPN